MVDFAALKAQARQTVHNTMKVAAEYTHAAYPGVVTVLQVRWHNKIARVGDLVEIGYSEIVEGINRVIFNVPELNEKSIVLQRGGQLKLTGPHFFDAVLILESMEPMVGPIEQIWLVAHER